jgi:hypothetical protein
MIRIVLAMLGSLALAIGITACADVSLPSQAPTSGAAVVAPSSTARPTSGPASTVAPPGTPSQAPTPEPTPTPAPTPTPEPTPVLVPAPLTGAPVTEDVAARHVVAVMIDDLSVARPQSGLSQADVVWQAPAEGGIPRYMALFQSVGPTSVGPIRSSRLYYIAWAAEWRSVYAHSGGSPQALALLRSSQGKGKVVYNADEFRWSRYLYRVKYRNPPHNVYSDAKNLQKLSKRVGAKPVPGQAPVWIFAPDAPLDQRPVGGKIVVPYLANKITYTYDRETNTYKRSVSVEGKEYDAGTKPKTRIAPKNVVVMRVVFVPLGDRKHRLDGQVTGSGTAWVSTNGVTTKGTWRKKSFTSPTRFYAADGKQIPLTIGQTFIQVVPKSTKITIQPGTTPSAVPASPPASPSESPSAAP